MERNQNRYLYDDLDRLTYAEITGIFYDQTYVTTGYVPDDILGKKWMPLDLAEDAEIKFDFGAGSIGINLGEAVTNVGRLVVLNDQAVPGAALQQNRVEKRNLQILKSSDNITYTPIPDTLWEMEKDPGGNLIITFTENVEARYLKVHSNYDDRNRDGSFKDLSEFRNQLGKMVLVYKRLDKVTEEYGYDSVGNREWRKITGAKTVQTNYGYYPAGDGSIVRTNRLLEAKTVFDGQKVTDAFAYQYDRAGNMVTKGNIYQIRDVATDAVLSDHESLQGVGARSSAVSVDYTATDGLYVEYWEYGYNLRNRMECVRKNGQEVARYSYDYAGKRSRSEEGGEVLHFVYGLGGELVYQVNPAGAGNESFVHAFGRVIVKWVGNVAANAELSYYHHDNLGSTILMTDVNGLPLFKQDYAPFGQTLHEPGVTLATVQMEHPEFKYTGQCEDTDTGLYYYNARYYDSEPGRFTREDEYQGDLGRPLSQNLYIYTYNNPLKNLDPSGNAVETFWDWFSLTTGAASFTYSVKNGDVLGAVVDGAGVVADSFALLVPGLPGGAGAGINAIRGTRAVADVADVVGGSREIMQGIENGDGLQTVVGVLQVTAGVGGRFTDVDTAFAAKLPDGENLGNIKVKNDFIVSKNGIAEELSNGQHVFKKHIGLTDADLFKRLADDDKIRVVSSFTDDIVADYVALNALTNPKNMDKISNWLSGTNKRNLEICYVGATVIGKGVEKGSKVVENMTNALIILKKNESGGFFILTAYPTKKGGL